MTDLDGDVVDVDRFHREHAVVELAIKDLKAGAGLEQLPSGVFSANSAWFQIAILAHNMIRWTAHLSGHDTDRLVIARTIRTRLLALPGGLVNRAGQPTLRLPARWPWANTFTTFLDALRAVEPVPTRLRASRSGAPQNPLQRHQPDLTRTRFFAPQPLPDLPHPTTTTPPPPGGRAPKPSRWIEAKVIGAGRTRRSLRHGFVDHRQRDVARAQE